MTTKIGLIYRNPIPHLRSVNAYFPSLAMGAGGRVYCTMVLAEAFEALNLRVFIAASDDLGETWTKPLPLNTTPLDHSDSESGRLTSLPNGELLALTCRFHRAGHLEESLCNSKNIGLVPTTFHLHESSDGGATWRPRGSTWPQVGYSSFELCSSVVILDDNTWLLPSCAWRGWSDEPSVPFQTGAFVSRDQGESWTEFLPTFTRETEASIYWESKIVVLPDGRWLSVAWHHDEKNVQDRPNAYILSEDKGRTWSLPASTELHGQTLTPLVMPDGSVLCVYRRVDRPGLWAQQVRIQGKRWINEREFPIWGYRSQEGGTHQGDNTSENFRALRFGAPSLLQLPDQSVLGAFWCYEDGISNIRRFHIG